MRSEASMTADSSNTPSVAAFAHTELDEILSELESLRHTIVNAWRERAIILTKDEQQRLREEIRRTCDLLGTLISEK